MRFLKPGVCLLVGLGLCALSTAARAEASEEAVVTVNTSRMDPSVGVCQSGAPLDDAPEAMLRFVNDCPIGERELEVLRGDDGPLREIRDAVGDATGELLALIVELQSMRYRPEHAMFGADRGGPKLSVSRAVARFYSVVEYNEASLGLNDLSLIRTAIQRLLEQSVEDSSPQLGRQMMGRVRFILARSTARCTQLAGSVGRSQARAASLLCEDLAVYGELAADFADLRSLVAYWGGYVAVVEWSRWQSDAPRRVAQGLRQRAALSVRTALEEPARRGRERLVRTSGALLSLSATSSRVETVELAREAAFELWHALSAGDRPSLAPYLRFVMLARVRVGAVDGEGAVIGHNHLLGEARALGDGLLQGSAENPFPGALVEWPLIGRDVRLTAAALEVARRANALPGRAGGVHRNAVMLGAAQTLCHFFSRERLDGEVREEALGLMVEALRQNRLGDLAEAFWDHHQAPTQQRGFEVPAETLEEVHKLEAVLGDYNRASGRDRAGHLDGLMPLYEPLFRQLWFLRAIPGSGASAHLSRLRAMMPVEVRQSGALFEVGRRPEGALDARSAWSSERGVWTGTRLDPVRGDYDLLPVGAP